MGWLLTSLEYSIGYDTIIKLAQNKRDILEPLRLQTASGVSLRLAFHSLTQENLTGNRYWNLDFYVEDLVDKGLSLEVDVTLSRIKRGAGAACDANKASWPAPEPGIATTLTGNGAAGSVPLQTTRLVAVRVEVRIFG